MLRVFIALEIPAAVQQLIAEKTLPLRKQIGDCVRWVNETNLHLTLKFIGEIAPTKVTAIQSALEVEARNHTAFEIKISGIGAFPNPKCARVIWIGINALASITTLQRGVDTSLKVIGYPAEIKPFSPHLTLGRVKDRISVEAFTRIRSTIEASTINHLADITITSVHLYKSDLRPGRSIYTKLFSVPLRGDIERA